ncbi:hypothetical protein, partial [Paracoccus sp. FO-3]|uniref:hypothetical protein n=1 Tax=Paracoccus sp. FO-3 TaxID=1335059 RepID=UPI00112A7DC7
MSKMTLVLHIGTEKTGTTLIQKWLYQNRGRFLENGIYLSNSLGWENNRSLVAYFRSEPDEFWTFNGIKNKEQKEQFFASFLTDLEAEIEQASANNHTMVITSEHFHSRLTDENDVATFSDFCRRNFKDHVVVCYLRPQWDVRKSIYSTDLRNNESRRFSQYRSDISASDKYFDYLNLYRRWKRNFAYAQIEFRNYDRSSFIGNDLRKDFASVFPIAIDVNDFEFSDKRENESLALLESAAYAAVNRAVPLFEGQSVNKRNYEYKKLLSDLRVLKRGTLADPLSHKVYDTFKDSNN